jgi:hypothetical protein
LERGERKRDVGRRVFEEDADRSEKDKREESGFEVESRAESFMLMREKGEGRGGREAETAE